MGNICWIASYPKSGNTWLRMLLANYRADSATPADINSLGNYGAPARIVFDEWAGIRASALDDITVDNILPDVYRSVAREENGTVFFKAHDMFRFTSRGEPLFPPDVSTGAVYLVRNVSDVAISFAHHAGIGELEAVERLCDSHYAVACSGAGLDAQLRQVLGSWSEHVSSWLDQSAIPLYLVRYEDLLRSPVEVFGGIAEFCGLPFDEERVRRAVASSRFDELQRQERTNGFSERLERSTTPFFRRGRTGDGAESLPAELVQRLLDKHRYVLLRLKYLR
jgi:aryl sulfotransferase